MKMGSIEKSGVELVGRLRLALKGKIELGVKDNQGKKISDIQIESFAKEVIYKEVANLKGKELDELAKELDEEYNKEQLSMVKEGPYNLNTFLKIALFEYIAHRTAKDKSGELAQTLH